MNTCLEMCDHTLSNMLFPGESAHGCVYHLLKKFLSIFFFYHSCKKHSFYSFRKLGEILFIDLRLWFLNINSEL